MVYFGRETGRRSQSVCDIQSPSVLHCCQSFSTKVSLSLLVTQHGPIQTNSLIIAKCISENVNELCSCKIIYSTWQCFHNSIYRWIKEARQETSLSVQRIKDILLSCVVRRDLGKLNPFSFLSSLLSMALRLPQGTLEGPLSSAAIGQHLFGL